MASRYNLGNLSQTPSPDPTRMDHFKLAAERVSGALTAAGISHAFTGGFALVLLGNSRVPADIDIVVNARLVPDVWEALDIPDLGISLPSTKHHDDVLKILVDVSGVSVTIDILTTGRALGHGARLAPPKYVRCRTENVPILDYVQFVNTKLGAWNRRGEAKDSRDIFFLIRKIGKKVPKKDLNNTLVNNFCNGEPAGLTKEEFKKIKKALKGKELHCAIM